MAGSINSNGYRQMEYKNKHYMVHRVIFEMHNGPIPEGMEVDHADRNRLNNDISNLRLSTERDQCTNSSLRHDNTSGYKGVYKRSYGKFRAMLKVEGKNMQLGEFDTAEEADDCVKFMRDFLYGEFSGNS